MNIGAVTLAYQDESIIAGTIKCLEQFVDTHIVLLSEKPYFGEGGEPDATEEIALDLGADVVKGTWDLDHYQRNLGNNLLSDMDWILTFDSDEMMTAEDVKKLITFLHQTKEDAILIKPEIYWRTTDYRLRPHPSYCPPIAMRPNVRFTHIRCIDSPYEIWNGGEMHHLSWCEPKDIKKKITCYAHALEQDWATWYKEKYLKWKEGDMVEFPYGENHTAEYNPLPRELNEYLSCSTNIN